MPREGMLIDPKSYDLAEHFLNDGATDAMKQELAEWIQWQVELWLYDDKKGRTRPLIPLAIPSHKPYILSASPSAQQKKGRQDFLPAAFVLCNARLRRVVELR